MRISRERNRRRVAAGACLISLTAILTKKKSALTSTFFDFFLRLRAARISAPAGTERKKEFSRLKKRRGGESIPGSMNLVIFKTAALLILSNCFMTYAWYGHLKGLKTAPLFIAVLASWGIAFFEYMIMVPANRLGYGGGLALGQLKIMQEVITLCVFVPFALLFMGEKWRWDYLWAFLCIVGAVYFVFRDKA